MNYELVPAVLICSLCGKAIKEGEKWHSIKTTKGGIESETFEHDKCEREMIGYP